MGKKQKISRNVWLLGFVSFFNDVASEMLYPIVPLFLTAVLGASALAVGIIEGVAGAVASIFGIVAGRWSDRLQKRKPFLIVGYILGTIEKLILALAYTWPVVLLARVTNKFGKGTRTAARDALIADSSDKRYLGAAFGLHRALDTAGAVVGPLFLLLLLSLIGENYRTMFLLSLIPCVIGVLLLLFVKEKKSSKKQAAEEKTKPSFSFKDFSGFGIEFKLFLFASALFSLGNSSDVFLILRTNGIGYSLFMVVAAYVLYNIIYALFSYPAGIIADKFGKIRVIVAGLFVFAFVYLGFAYLNEQWVFPLFAIYGVYIAFTDGISKAYIAHIVPANRRGAAIGLFVGVTGILALFASIIAGALWSYINPQAAFLFGSILAFISAIIMMFIGLRVYTKKARGITP